jgi:DNA-binding XRE family transcriptional regulator
MRYDGAMRSTVITQPVILGQAIKAARRSSGLTQIELAEAVGSYPRAIIEIERGRANADIKLILAVLSKVGLQLVVESQ